jgi:hypothetical protein
MEARHPPDRFGRVPRGYLSGALQAHNHHWHRRTTVAEKVYMKRAG